MPPLHHPGLRDCQITAIENLEAVLQGRPAARAGPDGDRLGQDLHRDHVGLPAAQTRRRQARPVLVDTKNLGEQAEQEFMAYLPNDDNRKFTELYNVQRLKSSFVAKDSQVCISTIQRMYSLLKDEPLDEAAEEDQPGRAMVQPKAAAAGRLQPEDSAGVFRFHHHR